MITEIRAIFPAIGAEGENAKNYAGDKEEVNRLRVIAFDAREARDSAERAREHGYRYSDRDRGRYSLREPADARFFMGRSSAASVVYCSVWIRTRDGRYFSGRGDASGGGYHKESAALAAAIQSAGVRLEARDVPEKSAPPHISERDAATLAEHPDRKRWREWHFGGAGERAMEDALLAIADAAGYKRCPRRVL